jgi:hypothetical protein
LSYPEVNTDDLNKKLTRVYVALVLTQNLAEGNGPGPEKIRSIETLIQVASTILEEILASESGGTTPWPLVHEETELLM